MILAAIVIARNPAQYGFSFESEDGPAFETVTPAARRRAEDASPSGRGHAGRESEGAQPGAARGR